MSKKILILLLVLSNFICLNVYAQDNDTTSVENISSYCSRAESNNYGVNKKWKITEYNMSNVLSTACVDTTKKVYDLANVISSEDEDYLRDLINKYIEKTNFEIVIITVDLPYSVDSINENYAADFYDYNDFGLNFDGYSGTVILRNVYAADPYYNIYTFGNAQLYYHGIRTENVLSDIYSDLHNGFYKSGFEKFINNLDNYYDEGIPEENENDYVDSNGIYYEVSDRKFSFSYLAYSIISGLVTIIIICNQISKNKMVRTANMADNYLLESSVNFTKKETKFIKSVTTYTHSSSGSGFSGGGGCSVGSSGGGHSSGGGRHG